MRTPTTYSFTIEGETYKGSREQLITKFAGMGYAAVRDGKAPDQYWQYEEYLKRGGRDQK